MSSTFSAESAASPSGSKEPGCEPSHSARSIPGAGRFSESTGRTSPATTTSERCRSSAPISCVEASLASPLALLREDEGSPKTFGPKCFGSSDFASHPTSSLKTSRSRQSPTRLNVSNDLAMARTTAVYRGLIAGLTISEIVGGQLHTPTRKANFVAPSMQKWPSCRRFVAAFGGQRITPEQFEFLLGYPIGWTALAPSEMPSSRKSRKRSGARS